ncbi:MAG: hypothetical protein AAF235_08855 [Planctomycetota bacterium]
MTTNTHTRPARFNQIAASILAAVLTASFTSPLTAQVETTPDTESLAPDASASETNTAEAPLTTADATDAVSQALRSITDDVTLWFTVQAAPEPVVRIAPDDVIRDMMTADYLATIGLEPGGNGIERTRPAARELASDAVRTFPMHAAVIADVLLVRESALDLAHTLATKHSVPQRDILEIMALRAVARAAQLEGRDVLRPARRLPVSIPPFEVHRAAMLGQAAWIQKKVAQLRGEPALVAAVEDLHASRPSTTAARLEARGMRFVEQAITASTMQSVWSVISRPPDSLAVIAERLPTADIAAEARSPYGAALVGFADELPEGTWEYRSRGGDVQTVLGRSMALISAEPRDRLITDTEYAEQLGWTDVDAGTTRYCALTVLRFPSASAAARSAAAFEIIVNVSRDRVDNDIAGDARSSRPFRVGNDTIQLIAGDHLFGSDPAASFVAAGRLGDHLLMINFFGIPGDENQAEAITTDLVTRIRAVVDAQ